jgi:hypothetical protein
MIIAELIEQLQTQDPKTEVLAVRFTAADFEVDGEPCSDLAFRSAIKNAADEVWEDADYVIGREVYSAMGWGETGPIDKCADECVCGGGY